MLSSIITDTVCLTAMFEEIPSQDFFLCLIVFGEEGGFSTNS